MDYPKEFIGKFKGDKIAVLPTDTIYGVVASAFSKKAVAKIYRVLRRNSKKPLIILIGSLKDMELFDIENNKRFQKILRKVWPGKVSVVLPCPNKEFRYLHRGTKTLAFRMPKKPSLKKLLKITGPLVSTSANPEGERPAETVSVAKKYFGDNLDFYVNGGKIRSLPSTLVEIKNEGARVLRKGAGKLPKGLIS